ncbi:36901_t:CDS:2 [Gigaspora margarita]|uniref:36901_t:CDS:1 n=1 Tax=Gigaspora margarita TaxID=4874 RepID=A0ABN7VDL8_GIGMA|nr:36901_t:CDS:2 [Gigaspora margarita]
MKCDLVGPQKIKDKINISVVFNSQRDQECSSYLTNPSEKDGVYIGYFSIPFENNYRLIFNPSNDTKYEKRDEVFIDFTVNFMDRNASQRVFVRVSDSGMLINTNSLLTINTNAKSLYAENVYLKENISSIFLQSITQSNTYQVLPGDVLNSLGLLGGAWSLAAVAYKLLFGDDTIQPFGLVQKYGYFYKKTQKKLTKVLSTFPSVQIPDPSNNIDVKNRAEQLEKKIDNLELFLRDYVVEVQQLDKVYNNIENVNDNIENVNDNTENVNDNIENVNDNIENVNDNIENVNYNIENI